MKKASVIILKIISTAAALFASYYALIIIGMFLFWNGINHIIAYIGLIVVPSLLLPFLHPQEWHQSLEDSYSPLSADKTTDYSVR